MWMFEARIVRLASIHCLSTSRCHGNIDHQVRGQISHHHPFEVESRRRCLNPNVLISKQPIRKVFDQISLVHQKEEFQTDHFLLTFELPNG